MKRITLFILLFTLAGDLFSQGAGNVVKFSNFQWKNHGQFIYCGSPNYGFTNEITVAAWVKWTEVPGSYTTGHEQEGKWATIITMDHHIYRDQGQFWLHHSQNNTYFEWAVRTTNERKYVYSTTQPQANKWYYLTGTYDGSTLKFYINGVLENSISLSGNINPYNSLYHLNIGRITNGYRLFSGNIDEIRIWNKALTNDQIIQQMYSKSSLETAYLKSYWALDNSEGSVVDDEGSQNADGKYYAALIDIHGNPGYGTDENGRKFVEDNDKQWTTDNFAGLTARTIAGAGIGDVFTVYGNTSDRLTFNSGYNWSVEPKLDDYGNQTNNGMTWIGVEASSSSTSQWMASAAPVATSNLDGLTDVRGIWDTKSSNTSSILTVSNTNIDANNTDECLLFAHNNSPLSEGSSNVPTGIQSRLARIWKFQIHKTGGVTGTISIDCSNLIISNPDNLRLLISGSSDFTNASVFTGSYSGNIFTATISTFLNPFNSITDGSFITLGTTEGTLPVKLLSFSHKINMNNVSLNWVSAEEINNSGFEIYRYDNKNWEKIGFVKGKNLPGNNNYEYLDKNLQAGIYKYKLKQIDFNGNFEYFELNENVEILKPGKYSLFQNYPNPFNPVTTIRYAVSNNGFVKINVYDLLGRKVANLVNELKNEGIYSVDFYAPELSTGVYIYRMEVNGFTEVRRMLLIK